MFTVNDINPNLFCERGWNAEVFNMAIESVDKIEFYIDWCFAHYTHTIYSI